MDVGEVGQNSSVKARWSYLCIAEDKEYMTAIFAFVDNMGYVVYKYPFAIE